MEATKVTDTPTEHHASIGTKDGLTEFLCCEQNEPAFAESWDSGTTGVMNNRETIEELLEVFNRIAGHLTEHRDDKRTQIVVEGGQTQVLVSDDVLGGIRTLARHLPSIHVTSTAK